ncbi:winged helix-turn-helix domain-containing protein [Vibrio lamellibrachiae]|uniref:winged helix-turn-helix domain-containing protein n=1 Tax=Vibrio lamellibrachiae TaxID=2910253 RepID=UPI003D147A6E
MVSLKLEPPIYQIGDYLFSTSSGVVKFDNKILRLRPREAMLFQAMIDKFPEVLSREEIEKSIWKDLYEANATINQTVRGLRTCLKDGERTFIRTIPKKGYLLSVQPILKESLAEPEPLTERTNAERTDLQEKPAPNISQASSAKVRKSELIILSSLSIAAFLVGVVNTTLELKPYTSHYYHGHQILFDSSEDELKQLGLIELDQKSIVSKGKIGYHICNPIERGLECRRKKLD